jgi:hypothetical protein
MKLEPNVFDVWTFRKTGAQVEYLLLHTSQYKADRYFNGGRFWQIPSGFVRDSERVVPAIERLLAEFALTPMGIWATEHVYNIYNRRFETMQMIAVYAADVGTSEVRLDPKEHAEYRWCSFDEALALVNYRGLKEGLRSTREYVTGLAQPSAELRLL